MSKSDTPHIYGLFDVLGIEIEYMIVAQDTLKVMPLAEKIFTSLTGSTEGEAELEKISISNELVQHVIELKTTVPEKILESIIPYFQQALFKLIHILQPLHATLLPSAAHPWMDPEIEMQLWPHDSVEIYQAYNRIFSCKGHGWSNLQSMHINLPFNNEEDFVRLHSAIRLILPLIPAIAASSPIISGYPTGFLDTRLEYYRKNQARIPSISGKIIPEFVNSYNEYHEKILQPMYREIAPFDREGLLQEEWLNSRGAIARFDRSAIEIRIIDSQECITADLAIAHFIAEVLKLLVFEEIASFKNQVHLTEDMLLSYFLKSIADGGKTKITDQDYLRALGISQEMSIMEIWRFFFNKLIMTDKFPSVFRKNLDIILTEGSLAERILSKFQMQPRQQNLLEIYQRMSECLLTNQMFTPSSSLDAKQLSSCG